jgi:hypothetical protein
MASLAYHVSSEKQAAVEIRTLETLGTYGVQYIDTSISFYID